MSQDPESIESSVDQEIEEFLRNGLGHLYDVADMPRPSDKGIKVGALFVGLPPDDLANQIAGHIRGRDLLFRLEDEVGTIDPRTGRWRVMTDTRFRTWLPSKAGMIPFKKVKKRGEDGVTIPIKEKIAVEDAKAVLASDVLLDGIDEIKVINSVRLPVMREDGRIELLAPGYDVETGVYTVESLKYDLDLEHEEAWNHLEHLLKYFGLDERSRAVQIAAMVTVFGASLFRGRSPLFVWNSNLPGAGKSRLAQLAVHVIHPDVGASGFHLTDRNETRKEMDATAQERLPVLWFDDVEMPSGFVLRSGDLNRWLTAKAWAGRTINTQKKFKVEVDAATLMTGTHIRLNDHIGRRSLFVDMFAKQRARDRKLPSDAIELDDQFFEDQDERAKILASLWSIIRFWDQGGRPRAQDKPLPSFEGWSAVVPGVVFGAPFGNCLEKFEAPDAGEVVTREIDVLVKALVRDHLAAGGGDSFKVDYNKIIGTARLNGLFQDRLQSLEWVVSHLETKHGWEWEKQISLMTATPEDQRAVFRRWQAGGFISDKEEDALSEWTLEGDPTEESKRRQAASWRDKSIDGKFSTMFREAAVAGQYFIVDEETWSFGDRGDYQGAKFEIYRVQDEGER